MLYALTDVPGGRWTWEEVPQHNIRTFAAHGVRLFQVDLFLEHVWFEDGTFDVSMAQKQVRGVLDVCPDGAVMIHFQRWLKAKYRGDGELQAAWGDPAAMFATAEVPGLNERRTTRAGIFRDPLHERKVMDYYKCQHERVADLIVHFCRTAGESWPRPLLKGAFYGYYFALFGRQAAGGHLELERVLNSKEVDFLCSPRCYCPLAEKAGEPYRARGLLDTCRLHGKLWLEEMDQDPNVGRGPGARKFSGDSVSSVGKVRRNVVSTFVRGMGLWFYDFGPALKGSGWWDHPDLMAQVRGLNRMMTPFVTKPYTSDADVLVVYDTESFYHTASAGCDDPVSTAMLDEMTAALYLSGVAFHSIHRMDLRRIELAPYKVVVLANLLVLDAAERVFVSDVVATHGRHVVSMFAPGYSDGKRLDAAYVSEAAGLELALVSEALTPEIVVERDGWPVCVLKLAGPAPLAPLFAVKDVAAKSHGRFAGSAHVGLASKQVAGGVRWFCSLPPTDPGLLRNLFRSGVTRTNPIRL